MSQLQENQIFADRYRLVKRLGSGAFSEVWKAEDIKAGNLVVAIKIYAPDKGMDEDGVKVFSQEYSLVFNVTHVSTPPSPCLKSFINALHLQKK